mgnify:CR=1 FL=1
MLLRAFPGLLGAVLLLASCVSAIPPGEYEIAVHIRGATRGGELYTGPVYLIGEVTRGSNESPGPAIELENGRGSGVLRFHSSDANPDLWDPQGLDLIPVTRNGSWTKLDVVSQPFGNVRIPIQDGVPAEIWLDFSIPGSDPIAQTRQPAAWNDPVDAVAITARYEENYERVLVPSSVSGITGRSALVVLPPGYGTEPAPESGYPVLYLFDGQNMFTSGGWHFHVIMRDLIEAGEVAPFIAVAVPHGSDRVWEYSPTSVPFVHSGGGPLLMRYIVEDVIADVEAQWRIDSDRRYLGGSSMGGLMTLYGLWEHGDVFAGGFAMSPFVSAGNDWMRRQIESDARAMGRMRIYLDSGTVSRYAVTVTDDDAAATERLRDALLDTGIGDRMRFAQYQNHGHKERWWRMRLPDALRHVMRPFT